jgi:soluble lytic murein transglycosylase-like protein
VAAGSTGSPSASAIDGLIPYGVGADGQPQYQGRRAAEQTVAEAAKPGGLTPPGLAGLAATPTPQAVGSPVLQAGLARLSPSLGLTGFWKVISYRDLIQRSADASGADPAIIAALMEVEGSGEGSISSAGAMGLMQQMPDKFRDGDDPFDPATNILRAAQHIRVLQDRWHMPELVAAAYFGAIDAGVR